MSALLKISNISESIVVEKSYLNADTAAGATAVVKSAATFATNYYALVGTLGQELTELCRISLITTNTLTLVPNLANAHDKYTDVTALRTNQIKIYRAANVNGTAPADGSFSVLATVAMNPEDIETTYNDATGGSDYWYKYTYYNSATAFETDIADSTATRGGSSHYATIEAIRREGGMNGNDYISDIVISEKRDEAEDIVNSMLGDHYDIPFDEAPAQITRIVELLAGGMLLSTDYGPMASGTTKDGQAKIDQAMELLRGYKNGTTELIDIDGVTLALGTRTNGWPLDETADARAEDNGAARNFRMSDKF